MESSSKCWAIVSCVSGTSSGNRGEGGCVDRVERSGGGGGHDIIPDRRTHLVGYIQRLRTELYVPWVPSTSPKNNDGIPCPSHHAHLELPRRNSTQSSKGFSLDIDTGSDVRDDISSENVRVSEARLAARWETTEKKHHCL